MKLRAAEEHRVKSMNDLMENKNNEIEEVKALLGVQQLEKLAELRASCDREQEARIRELRTVWNQVRFNLMSCDEMRFSATYLTYFITYSLSPPLTRFSNSLYLGA